MKLKMHRYEEIWLLIGCALLIVFMLITGYQTFAREMGPPSGNQTIDWRKLDETAPFDKPGLRQTGDNEYEAVVILEAFGFTPSNIEIPAGATVKFILTSKDVVHGFEIAGTNVNAMVPPGYVQEITQTFGKPGEYLVLCNEYCGIGHQMMSTVITVI